MDPFEMRRLVGSLRGDVKESIDWTELSHSLLVKIMVARPVDCAIDLLQIRELQLIKGPDDYPCACSLSGMAESLL
jgi:hypothetical protein